MSHLSGRKYLAKVVEGKLVFTDPGIDLPEDSVVELVVGKVMSKQCRWVWRPGILVPPTGPTAPRVRTRCVLEDGHTGDHDYGFVRPVYPRFDEDDSEDPSV